MKKKLPQQLDHLFGSYSIQICIPVDRQPEEAYTYVLVKTS